jgi:hypothetical protein
LRGPMGRVLAFVNRKLAAHGLSRVN